METPPRHSNARDYEITAGRLCPHCGNETRSLITRVVVVFFCEVCSKTWPALPEKYR